MLIAVGHLRSFDMEQVIQLFALACDKPEHYDRPLSHWTAQELASEMVKLGIALEYLSTPCGTTVKRSRP